jgi:hypothetical protein
VPGTEVVFEDPVGGDHRIGRDAPRTHFKEAVNTHEAPGEPVAGQDDVHVLIPVMAIMDYRRRRPDREVERPSADNAEGPEEILRAF